MKSQQECRPVGCEKLERKRREVQVAFSRNESVEPEGGPVQAQLDLRVWLYSCWKSECKLYKAIRWLGYNVILAHCYTDEGI